MRTILSRLRMIVKLARSRGTYDRRVLVVNRFRVPAPKAGAFRADLERAHAALAARPGYVDGTVGRNVDDPTLWVLVSRWEHVGAYRRALSSYDVKLHAVPVLEPGDRGAQRLRGRSSRAADLNVDIPRA